MPKACVCESLTMSRGQIVSSSEGREKRMIIRYMVSGKEGD